MDGRGRHFEHKIWFLIINQVQPTLFLKNLSFIKVKWDLATETNEDNDFTTVIHIVVILCFIEHLCYPQGPAEMFNNVFILMECYLKLGPDFDYGDFYLLGLLLPNWLALLPNLIGIQKQKQKPKCLY